MREEKNLQSLNKQKHEVKEKKTKKNRVCKEAEISCIVKKKRKIFGVVVFFQSTLINKIIMNQLTFHLFHFSLIHVKKKTICFPFFCFQNFVFSFRARLFLLLSFIQHPRRQKSKKKRKKKIRNSANKNQLKL